jgi:hypothetical protein
MTEQPPPASPPPSSSSPSGGSAASNPFASAHKYDLGIIGAGLLAFIGSLLPYYTVSVKGFGGDSVTAWHGFFGWFGALCALAGAVVLVLAIMKVSLPVPVRITVLALFGLAVLCTVLALFVFPGGGCDDAGLGVNICDQIDTGHGFGYWFTLLMTVVGLVLSAMRKDDATA